MDIYDLVSAISDFIDREQFPDLDDFDEEDMQDYLFEEFEPLQLVNTVLNRLKFAKVGIIGYTAIVLPEVDNENISVWAKRLS